MKINNYYSQNTNPFNDQGHYKSLKKRLPENNAYKNLASKQLSKNKTELTGPAQAISFGGSPISAANTAVDGFGKKFIRNGFLNNVADFVYENEAAYNAVYSLVIAGILKPMFVLSMPGSEEKDKQIVATKNFLQAFIGSFLGLTIGGGIIKKTVEVIENNMKMINLDKKGKLGLVSDEKAQNVAKDILIDQYEKNQKSFKSRLDFAKQQSSGAKGLSKAGTFVKSLFAKREIPDYEPAPELVKEKAGELLQRAKEHLPIFEKNTPYITKLLDGESTKTLFTHKDTGLTLMDAYKSCWKNSTGFLTAIGKAKISSLLLPGVMATLFAKRNLEKQKEKQKENREKLADSGITLITSNKFKNDRANFAPFMSSTGRENDISFTGSTTESIINGLAKGVEALSMTKFGEKSVGALSKFKKQSARMSDLESILLTTYWVQNTARSKKIDPDQKLGLNVHTVLVTAVSSLFAFLIDWALDGSIEKIRDTYKATLQNAVDKNDLASIQNLLNSKKFTKQVTTQNNISRYAQELLKHPNAPKETLNDAAKKIFGEINPDDLQRHVKEAQTLSENATKIKELSAKGSKEAITKILESYDIKMSEEKIGELLKSNSPENIVRTLTKSINSDTVSKTAKLYKKQLSKFKSLTVFTLVVRFLVPVLMVPISGKLKKKVIELTSKKNTEKTDKNKVKTA